ncbi:MAG TPA: HAD hydrolase-like protein, partial [Burkholderiaceae bacterium]|nr:HAD hydrolase-like protein [Burkholderiaceae bacterium]
MGGQFSAVLFDLDGTLIDTAAEIADGVNDTLAELGLPLVTEQQVRSWVGHGTQSLMVRACAEVQGLTEEAVHQSGQVPRVMAVFGRRYLA